MIKRKIHYGWFVVAAGMLIIAASIGLISNCFSILIVPVGNELGFTRSQMSVNQTILAMGLILVSFLWGTILKRFRLKPLMCIAAITACAAYFMYSLATQLWMFYVISSVLSICIALLSWMPFTTIINNWFAQRRGFALGMVFMGSGVGGMVFNALGGVLISSFGWRITIVIFTLALIVMLIPSVTLVIKIKPSDVGLTPYGEDQCITEHTATYGATLTQAMHMPIFYVIAICSPVIGACSNSMNAIMNPHLHNIGYSTIFAANTVSAYMMVLAAGKILLGVLCDKIGAQKACMLSLMCIFGAAVSATFAHFPLAVGAMALFTGLGNPFGSVAYPLVAREVFGPKDCSAITGKLLSLNNIGSAIGPTFCGSIFDATGNYLAAYYIMAGMIAVFGVTLIATMVAGARRNKWDIDA